MPAWPEAASAFINGNLRPDPPIKAVMATREQEARIYEEQTDTEPSE